MRIAYVGLFRVHQDNASLHRVVGIARSLQHVGHEVLVAGGDSTTRGDRLLAEGLMGTGAGDADPDDPITRKVARFWRAGTDAISWLSSLDPKPDMVIQYGGGAPFAKRTLTWCAENGVTPALDVVEWYDGSHMPLGRFGPFAMQDGHAMRRSYPRMRNVIAISSFLENYYTARGCNVVRIPPSLDVTHTEWTPKVAGSDGRIKLVYAGTPGKKDLLGPMLQALQQVDPDGVRFSLEVIGIDASALETIAASHRVHRAPATAVGRLTREQVLEHVAAADFVPLLRTDARYAHAGFPTKLVESMSLGTPMICNLTSDIGDHVVDGKTGVTVDGSDASAFATALERVASLTPQAITELRSPARREAERAFDYRSHAERLQRWLTTATAR